MIPRVMPHDPAGHAAPARGNTDRNCSAQHGETKGFKKLEGRIIFQLWSLLISSRLLPITTSNAGQNLSTTPGL
jgi:hypothetical protein